MKKNHRLDIVRIIVCVLTVLCIAAAVWLQISVSGDKLLTMDSQTGRWMAASYRWVTLAAGVLNVLAALLLVIGRKKQPEKTARVKPEKPPKAPKEKKTSKPEKTDSPAPVIAASPAATEPKPVAAPQHAPAENGSHCSACGALCTPGQKFCRQCGAKL